MLDKQAESQIQYMIEHEEQFDSQFAIDPKTGEYLHAFVLEKKPKRILELGTWRGASGIYLASALKELGGGELVTVDVGNDRVHDAKENFKQAGVSNYITQVISNIHDYLPNDATRYDLVFMDASKKNQGAWLQQLLQKNLQKGAWIIVDDYLTMGDRMEDLTAFVQKSDRLASFVEDIDDGLLVIEVLN